MKRVILIAALLAGFVTVACCQPYLVAALGLPVLLGTLAFPWQLCLGTAVATLVCMAPRGSGRTV